MKNHLKAAKGKEQYAPFLSLAAHRIKPSLIGFRKSDIITSFFKGYAYPLYNHVRDKRSVTGFALSLPLCHT